MDQTTNYKLPQWVEDDRIMMEDFNDAMAKIDAGIAGAKNAADSKATTEALTALAARVGAAGRTCRIAWGSYNGNGKYGSGTPTSITPGFYPVLVCVGSPADVSYTSWPWLMMRPSTKAQTYTGYSIEVSWTDTKVSWYGTNSAEQQMNRAGSVYYYVALGYDKTAETADEPNQ